MKKIYAFLLFSACCYVTIIAQPTLNSSNAIQNIGDSKEFYVADSNSVISNEIGNNVIFDYSNLKGYGNTKNIYILDPTNTPYSDEYPDATIADSTEGVAINKNYSRLNGTTSLTKEGIVAEIGDYGAVVGKYDIDPEIAMKFPFKYGDSFTDNYVGNFKVNAIVPVSTEGRGTANVAANAWGTLKLPLGISIDSVLVIETTEYLTTDTIFLGFPFNIDFLPFIITGKSINYYKPSLSNYPLLSIITGSYRQEGSIIDSTLNILSQYPLGQPTAIRELSETVSTKLYPNPSNNQDATLQLKITERKQVLVSVLNNLGQNIETVFDGILNPGEKELKIDTKNLSKGIYIIRINMENQVSSRKLIVE
jgi:hypothetical protein